MFHEENVFRARGLAGIGGGSETPVSSGAVAHRQDNFMEPESRISAKIYISGDLHAQEPAIVPWSRFFVFMLRFAMPVQPAQPNLGAVFAANV
jgi:hypothetical protein